MSFKVGDRVVFNGLASDMPDDHGTSGTVVDNNIITDIDNYQRITVKWDDHDDTHVPIIQYLVHEEIWNSPLYKLMSESSDSSEMQE